MGIRNYSNNAVETQLTAPVDDVTGSITVSSVSGWPSVPFTLVIDPDTDTEEVVLATFVAGTTVNITRGWDSTSAMPHTTGAVVKHAAVAADFRDANAHVDAIGNVHGVTSDVVGTEDAQTLTNKNISALNNSITDLDIANVAGLQGALDSKAPVDSPTFTGNPVLPASTVIGNVDGTELSYLDGATSNLQAQLDALLSQQNTNTTDITTLQNDVTTNAGNIAALQAKEIPSGGTTGQALVKNSNADFDLTWSTAAGGGGLPNGGTTGQVLGKLSDADQDVAWIDGGGGTNPGNGGELDVVPPGGITGGDEIFDYVDGSVTYRVHIFRTTDVNRALYVTTPVIGKLLIVGGGGAGGEGTNLPSGAGGGAGAVYYGDYALGDGQHNLKVGKGGAPAGANATAYGANGQNTTFDDLIAYGGGAGGYNTAGIAGVDGADGGCGGGSGYAAAGLSAGQALGGVGGVAENWHSYGGYTDPATSRRHGCGAGGSGGPSTAWTGFSADITGTMASYGEGGDGPHNLTPTIRTAPGSGGSGRTYSGADRATAGLGGVVIVRYQITHSDAISPDGGQTGMLVYYHSMFS